MDKNWIGKAVSLKCDDKLGVFQGTIKDISSSQITIIRAFRNGVPLRKQDAEVTLSSSDIMAIDIIPSCSVSQSNNINRIKNPTSVKVPTFSAPRDSWENSNSDINKQVSMLSNKITEASLSQNVSISPKCTIANTVRSFVKVSDSQTSNVAKFFNNLIPPKVEVKLGGALINSFNNNCFDNHDTFAFIRNSSKPIDIAVSAHCNKYSDGTAKSLPTSNAFISNCNSNGNTNVKLCSRGTLSNNQKKKRSGGGDRENKQLQTFGTPIDDLIMNEDFDFEGNLALFDKKAVWDDIESKQKPITSFGASACSGDLARSKSANKRKTYRHDENILSSKPFVLRQIQTSFESNEDYVTDQGLIIPTIPLYIRSKIQKICVDNLLTMDRQNDILGRGTTDLALMMLGGARRLIPNNSHQWPTIVIICDKNQCGDVAAVTARHLASHGLTVVLYFQDEEIHISNNREVSLYKATGNLIAKSINGLPSSPDLVILSTSSKNLTPHVKNWLTLENRCLSILAIDPPPSGFMDVSIKCSILPILPLTKITTTNCGLLYLCNMSVPEQFYKEVGITYKSPFGHKFVIQIFNN